LFVKEKILISISGYYTTVESKLIFSKIWRILTYTLLNMFKYLTNMSQTSSWLNIKLYIFLKLKSIKS